MAGHPLRPARDRWLGRHLPHQLPNPTWAHPMACGLSVPHFHLPIIRGISDSFPSLSPLHRPDSQALLTRPPLVSKKASFLLLPFDLHVLSLPPAFNLSHDQTLQFKFNRSINCLAINKTLLKKVMMNFQLSTY